MSSGYIAAASFAQRQLRMLDLLQPGRSGYAVPLLVELTGPVDEGALRRAFAAVVERHDVLRASFPLVDGVPVLAVRDELAIPLPVETVTAASAAAWRDGMEAAVAALAARPFDLERGPVMTALLLRPSDAVAAGCTLGLALVFHHTVADGASLPLFVEDLTAAYDAARSGTAPRWAELELQYPDYADWEQERFGAADSPALADALEHWRTVLRNVPAVLDLPVDRSRGSGGAGGGGGATVRLELPGPVGAELAAIARGRGATPYMAFLAVFAAVLHRWSGLDDLVVTVPVSKRTRPELAPLMGLLVDTLPLRLSCDPDTTFDALLDTVHERFRGAVRHRDVPFQRIVQSVGIERHADVVPLMQVLFGSLEPPAPPPVASDGSRFVIIDDGVEQTAKSDLSVVYRAGADRVELWCRYDTALFDAATVEALLGWVGAMVAAVVRDPGRRLGELPLVDEAAGRSTLVRFNATARPYPADRTVFGLFAETAGAHPDRPAIDEGGGVTSYAALAARAERLTAALAAAGVGPGDAVVVVLPLSARFVALLLAILRLGALYVPLDPAQPHARRVRLAEQVAARAVVLDALPEDDEDGYGSSRVLEAGRLEAGEVPPAPPPVPEDAGATAYVMFTSGSTGEPKGVAVPHRAIVRLVRNTDFAAFGPDTRIPLYSNPSFDASTLEIWAPLLNGGTTVVVERNAMLDPAALRRILAERAISMLWITAGLFHEIAGIDPGAFAGLGLVMTGGDVVSPDAVRAVHAAGAASGLRLLSCYGPTENTTYSTTYDVAGLAPEARAVPIGRPIANSTLYILDRAGNPLPPGVVGEIYVGGDGVASGYVGDPVRSAAVFLPDPFAGSAEARMYRTGDFGCWRRDGTVLFAGRADDQVKVRGFRIEPGEIATALGRHPSLRTVHVAAPRQPGGERHIVAYVMAHTAPAPAPAELRAFLEPLLPPHMLPHAYVPVEALALNLNGKIDRRALPPVEDHHFDRAGSAVPPRTDDERTLAAIWRDLLGLEDVGVTDTFFHVGGDSILAIRMAARAADAGLPLTPTDVFQLQTIERLAEVARAARPRPGRTATDRVFPAELVAGVAEGSPPPFLLASVVFDRPVDVVALAEAVQRLAERHEALRLRLTRDGGASRLEIAAYVARLPIRTVEAPGLDDAGLDAWIAAHAGRIGRGLDLESGVTIAATRIDRGPAAGPVVALALHRAVADEHALALVAAELEIALRAGHAAWTAPDGTGTYGDWLEWLERAADAAAASPGLEALEAAPRRTAAPPPLVDDGGALAITAERWLDVAAAAALGDTVPQRLAVAHLDVLAAALAAALPGSGGPVLVEAIDGARRLPGGAPDVSGLAANLDGVLTILAPAGQPMPMAERLRAVKAERQSVAGTAPVHRILERTFDLPAAALGVARAMGPGRHGAVHLHSLPAFGPSVRGALVATAAGGRVRLAWAGAEPAGGAAALLDRVGDALAAIAALAGPEGRPLRTPADFPLAVLSPAELGGILAASDDVEDIYPLSPMQEAMLIHTLAADRSEVNFEQSCMRVRGRFDHEAFRHAWATVFERHAVLRTSFRWRGLTRPLQVVHRSPVLPLTVETWPAFDAGRLEAWLAADRARGFDLERAPLVRLALIHVSEEEVYVVSSFHHLLVDGWCLGRLEREVRAAYESVRNRRPPLFDPPVPYRAYIAWLAHADREGSRRFFAELLAGLPERRRLFPPATAPARGFATARRHLDRPAARALAAFARRRGLTLATVLHYAWGVWLAGRLGTGDAVFGTTVSGRPAAVPGVDGIVGLFINNLPVRLRLAPRDRPADGLAAVQALLGRLQDHAHLSPTAVAEAAGVRHGALFDTLVVVENLVSGTSAWSGAEGLSVESVHSRLKTAYDLTFVAVPGDGLALSLVQPEDGRALEDGAAVLAEVAAILEALPDAADRRVADLPSPPTRPAPPPEDAAATGPVRFAVRPRSTLEAQIADAVADLRSGGDGEVDLDTPFWQLGVGSLELVQLALRLERRLGRPVPISLLLEHRSIAALARAVAAGQSWSPVVPMTGPATVIPATGTPGARGGGEEPFACVHPIAGDVGVFLDLARAMPADIPFWALQAPGLEPGQEPASGVEALAAANLEALAARGLTAPRRLGGYSFGGIVAFEMARQLTARGAPPACVVVIDTPAPLERRSILDPDPDRAHAEWLVRMAEVRARYQGIDPVLDFAEMLALPAADRFAVAVERLHRARLLPPAADAAWLERAHRTGLAQYAAYLAYDPPMEQAGDLPLALIRADAPRDADLGELENRRLAETDMGWQRFTRAPVRVCRVPGDHVSMLGADSVARVAEAIAGLLRLDPAPGAGAGNGGAGNGFGGNGAGTRA